MSVEDPDSSPQGTDPQDGAASGSGHVAQVGDCCHSIAIGAGQVWKTVWLANNEVHDSRKPNQLVPGDVIHVPPIEIKTVDKPTGKRHVFVRTGTHVRLRLRLMHGGRTVVKEAYLLRAGRQTFRGRTDGEGVLNHLIPGDETQAILEVPRLSLELRIRIRALPPADTILGIQARLRNLGYGCDLTGENDAGTSAALKCFQADMRLEPSGNPEPETKSSLVRQHGI